MTTTDMSCKELVELVTGYLENALSDVDRTRFETHLQSCTGCRNYLQQMRQTIALVGRLPESAITPEAQQELLQLFRTWKQS